MNANYDYRVLITSVGGYLGYQNIEYLKKSFKEKIWILSADVRELNKDEMLSDYFVKLPKGNSPNYIQSVTKYVKKFKINFIIPCSDEEAIALSNNLNKFKKFDTNVICQTPKINKVISNKIKTYKLLEKNNISVPFFKVAKSKFEFNKFIKYFYDHYDGVVIKEPKARGNRGTIVIKKNIRGFKVFNESREFHMSLNYFKKNKKKYIQTGYPKLVSERLFAPCYDVDVLSKNGKLIYNISRERINPAGVPFKGNIIRNNKKLDSLAKQIVNLLSLSWIVDVDIMTKSNGDPAVIEVNPRISGSAVVSMIAGVPLYKLLLDLRNNKKNKIIIKNPKDGLTIIPKTVCAVIRKNEKK